MWTDARVTALAVPRQPAPQRGEQRRGQLVGAAQRRFRTQPVGIAARGEIGELEGRLAACDFRERARGVAAHLVEELLPAQAQARSDARQRLLERFLQRHARFTPWDDVASIEPGGVHLTPGARS